MSLRDDFLEALRSVKKDFIKEYDPESEDTSPRIIPSDSPNSFDSGSDYDAEAAAVAEPTVSAPASADFPESDNAQVEMDAFRRVTGESGGEESAFSARDKDLDEEDVGPDVDTTPYRVYDHAADHGSGRYIFDDSDFQENSDQTVISKNTIIRGALQTEDSIQMYGQILGDIECKSNVLMAGKVRGNTTAANAYVVDAQVDGNLLCDDVVSIKNDAWILGNIRAQQADIDGKIKGNIEIRHSISIGSNSSVIGNISTDELEIKRGAFINGQIMMYSPSRDVIDKFDRFDQ